MPFPEPVIAFFYLIFSGMVSGAAPQGLYQLLGTNGLTEFQRIINASFVMQELLSSPNLALTVFAPTNQAIINWRSFNRQRVINSDILQNHIAPGAWDAKKLLELARSETKQDRRILSGFQNSPLWLQYFPVSANRPKSKFYINDALITTDQPSQAGSQFLYIIDDVLAPTGSFVTAQTFLENPSAQMHSDLAIEELQHEVEQMAHFKALTDTNAVFTFLLPNNAAFSSLKNRGAFDATTMKGHIISDHVLFLRSLEDSLFERSQSANQNQVRAFPSLMNANEMSPDCLLGFSNSSSQQQAFSLVTKGDSRYPKGRVYGNVVKANIPVSNGVIHIIDRILLVVEQDAKEILETRRDLFKFRELFNFADPKLLERLTSDPDLTIFVPNNAALLLLPRDKAGRLRQDRIMLDRILNMHMIPRRLTSDEINNVTTVQTSIAQRLTFQVRPTSTNGDKELFVDGNGVSARIVEPDVAATNAVIHVIDQVLGIPFMNALEKLRGEPGLSSTYKAFEQTKDLNSALSSTTANYTVFAPSDQAWLKLDSADRNTILSKPKILARILKRHLVEGRRMETSSLRKEDRYTATPSDVLIKRGRENTETLLSWKGHLARITTYDIGAVNGVIHIIDHVLFDRDIDLISSSGSVVFSSLLFVIVTTFFSII